jgi:predicted Zn-dependent peptidase
MKKNILFAMALISLMAISSFAVNPREMTFPPLKFEPPEPVRFIIDNGIIVYFLEDHQLPVITTAALFKGGTVYDQSSKIGLTELTATLLRTGGAGNRNPEQIDQDLDFVGAVINSASSNDYLMLDLRTLKKDADLGFEMLADMLQMPLFDTSKISLEISNRKDEIRRQNDDPGTITRRIYYQTTYAGHPYGNFATLTSMDAIKRDDIIAHYKKFYAPNNCILAISGDLTLNEAEEFVGKYFGSWEKSNLTLDSIPAATMRYKPGVYYGNKDINQANIRLGHLCIDDKNPDRYALDIVNFALGGGGFTSRLTGQVRTSAGLAYSVGSYIFNRPHTGVFFAYCQTRASAMSQAVQMMLDIIQGVKDSGITQEEMDMAKESIINSFVFNYATPDQIVNAKAMLELSGFPSEQMTKDLEAYKAVTLSDCGRVAGKYLDPKNMVITIVGNKEQFDKPMDMFGPITEVPMEIK